PSYSDVQRLWLAQTDAAVLTAGADLYQIIGDHPAEDQVLARLQELEPDDPAGADVLVRRAQFLVLSNRFEQAIGLLEAVIRTATARGDEVLLLDALLAKGYAHAFTGDCRQGRRVYARALALLERLRPRLSGEAYRVKRLSALRGSGDIEHCADANEA